MIANFATVKYFDHLVKNASIQSERRRQTIDAQEPFRCRRAIGISRQ
jgi:hypothetical protein